VYMGIFVHTHEPLGLWRSIFFSLRPSEWPNSEIFWEPPSI
jgi:hypothetical protein